MEPKNSQTNKNPTKGGGNNGIIIRKLPQPQQQIQQKQQIQPSQLSASQQQQQQLSQQVQISSGSIVAIPVMTNNSHDVNSNFVQRGDQKEISNSKKRKFPYPQTQEQLHSIYEQKLKSVKKLKPNNDQHEIQLKSNENSSAILNQKEGFSQYQQQQQQQVQLQQQQQCTPRNLASRKISNSSSSSSIVNSIINLGSSCFSNHSSGEAKKIKDKQSDNSVVNSFSDIKPKEIQYTTIVHDTTAIQNTESVNKQEQQRISSGNSNNIIGDSVNKRKISNQSSDSIDYDKLQEYIDLTESVDGDKQQNQTGRPLQQSVVKSRNMSIDSLLLKQIDEECIEDEEIEIDDSIINTDSKHQIIQVQDNSDSNSNSIQLITEQTYIQHQQQKTTITTNPHLQNTTKTYLEESKSNNTFINTTYQHSKPLPQETSKIDEFFLNRCFYITKLIQQNSFSVQLELTLAPPLDQNGVPQTKSSLCNIVFKMNVVGTWAQKLNAEVGDLVRVIGNFCSENKYCLNLDDNECELNIYKASMIIVEPYIMIPCTSIVKAFPCARNAMLSHQFKGLNTDINYALVLGNTIHGVFQAILQTMDFRRDSLQKMIKDAIQEQLMYLYFLKKSEQEVERDVERGVNNITKWLNMVFRGDFNQYGIKYRKFIAAEQEFNTHTYGIKGNIDSTIIIEDSQGNLKSTALEIKTGKNKSNAYRGQVLLYSLLISERFKNSNPENILLYIMDNDVKDGFQYINQSKIELDNIVMGRNEIAKWQKKNNVNPQSSLPMQLKSIAEYEDLPRDERLKFDQQVESMDFIRYPPMIRQTSECKYCFARNVCSITALSIEPESYRKAPAGQFPTFLDMEKTLQPEVKKYYKKFIECIQLEQNTETDRNNPNSQNKSQSFQRDTGLKIVSVESNQKGDSVVTLEKLICQNESGNNNADSILQQDSTTLSENTFVNLYTDNNITFSKGYLVSKEIDFKPKQQELNLQQDNNQNSVEVVINSDINQQSMKPVDIETQMQDIDRYFSQYLVYTLEFAHLMPQNFSVDALGGRDALFSDNSSNTNNNKDDFPNNNQQQEVRWTIETEPFSNFSYSMMRSNILALCTDNRFDKLKDLLVVNQPPYEIPNNHIGLLGKKFQKEFEKLNIDQKLAICRAILCQEYHMIQGVPGSGKTLTIVSLINILASMKKKILLVNFTNSQVDNVLVSLRESGFEKFVRLSSNQSSVDQRIRDKVVQPNMFKSMSQIQEFVDDTYVFGMTCLAMNNPILLSIQKFDYCIFDDASQISEPLALGPILMSTKFVMCGDYQQHGIAVKSFIAERKGMGQSLFERLCKNQHQNTTKLTLQYRVNSDIMELANKVTYDNIIQCNSDNIAHQKVEYSKDLLQQQPHKDNNWLLQSRQQNVLFIQTDPLILQIPQDLRLKNKSRNFIELEIIKTILSDLNQNTKPAAVNSLNQQQQQQQLHQQQKQQQYRICIVTATAEQSNYINKQIQQLQQQSENGSSQYRYDIITSVDRVTNQYQLQECDIMIFACGLWTQGESKANTNIHNNDSISKQDKDEENKQGNQQQQDQIQQSKQQQQQSSQVQYAIKDVKKLNYVLTRPKRKLIIIGSKENLKKQKALQRLLLACKMKGWYIELSENDQSIMANAPEEFKPYYQVIDK